MSDKETRMERGMEMLEKMGRDETMLNQKELYPDLYEFSVANLFGDIWSRPHLTLRERQLITLAANIALCRPTDNHSHYKSAKHIGISHEEIMETIIQTGHYSGWPTMAHAVEQYQEVLDEDD
ncbi:MAG: carboxymuconolactone decarboxylase family protein [Rhodospirillaceae bacterium]|jgi:4-carboxymuconolactone decarboxylase|nr:carboxymuconolactone decarboxylase family protein [Rhodospirillaceae bacterium]MBT4939784.1 carboxymuconolactone decarboxylase family protein [Rhodospirillaceae bacterium]MBT7268126.1 carboxymuconolactone decarboxylase family protein [Rhodospirillaceae bacterium]